MNFLNYHFGRMTPITCRLTKAGPNGAVQLPLQEQGSQEAVGWWKPRHQLPIVTFNPCLGSIKKKLGYCSKLTGDLDDDNDEAIEEVGRHALPPSSKMDLEKINKRG